MTLFGLVIGGFLLLHVVCLLKLAYDWAEGLAGDVEETAKDKLEGEL